MPPNQTLERPVSIHLKEAFKQELDKMVQVDYIKPSTQINIYVMVDGREGLAD